MGDWVGSMDGCIVGLIVGYRDGAMLLVRHMVAKSGHSNSISAIIFGRIILDSAQEYQAPATLMNSSGGGDS